MENMVRTLCLLWVILFGCSAYPRRNRDYQEVKALLKSYSPLIHRMEEYADEVNVQCKFSGKWYAEHVATLLLDCEPDDTLPNVGTVRGNWSSSDGDFPMMGRYVDAGTDYYLGFTIAYPADQAVSSLTGMYFELEESITTFWIMTNRTEPENNWQNSHIGKAVFSRVVREL